MVIIRSQSKCVLGKFRTVSICSKERADGFEMGGFTSGDDDPFVLGKYKSTERCIEILDEIQAHVETTGSGIVYQMPAE